MSVMGMMRTEHQEALAAWRGTWACARTVRAPLPALDAYQPNEPSPPLMGPTIRDVTQPP